MNDWVVTYTISERGARLFGIPTDEEGRRRAVVVPLWRQAVESSLNLVANGWSDTKPRVRAVRP